MDKHVLEYFSLNRQNPALPSFHKVIYLNEKPEETWENLSKQFPNLSKGWYELAQLSPQDRLEFTYHYWEQKISYHPHLEPLLNSFFARLDDIGIFLTQKEKIEEKEVHLVYSLSDDRGFYRGFPPASNSEILNLQKLFVEYMLPSDYLAFLQIHNGFWKATDNTGIISSDKMKSVYENFQLLAKKKGMIKTKRGEVVNPKSLMPFYESFGMHFFQCFWADWYPEEEMGNVYYSGETNTISEIDSQESEEMSYNTFIDWLSFYLEGII